MFKMFNFEHVSRLSIEIDNQQHREIKALAASEGMSIKDLILLKTIGKEKETKEVRKPQSERLVRAEDETEFLFRSAVNFKRLRGAVTAPDHENMCFNNLEELADALGI